MLDVKMATVISSSLAAPSLLLGGAVIGDTPTQVFGAFAAVIGVLAWNAYRDERREKRYEAERSQLQRSLMEVVKKQATSSDRLADSFDNFSVELRRLVAAVEGGGK